MRLEGLGDRVLEVGDVVAHALGLVLAAAVGRFEVVDDGLELGQRRVELLGALLLGLLEGLGVFGQLVDEGECLFEGVVDGFLVGFKTFGGWGCD